MKWPHVTIAAIEGYSIFGAWRSLSPFDWRVLAEDAFVLAAGNIARYPALSWAQSLPRLLVNLVGPARAKAFEACLVNRSRAGEALCYGLRRLSAAPGKHSQ